MHVKVLGLSTLACMTPCAVRSMHAGTPAGYHMGWQLVQVMCQGSSSSRRISQSGMPRTGMNTRVAEGPQ